jgi:hypothetical protein
MALSRKGRHDHYAPCLEIVMKSHRKELWFETPGRTA